ncbi:MAG: sugar ABC transporter permease [Anaerolineae bacterium]|nr:sugar ABC transporter permease [Anaerolineae bacterium]MCA9910210.1 sugar ABC transporter permease [Anaerolineae bacterium]
MSLETLSPSSGRQETLPELRTNSLRRTLTRISHLTDDARIFPTLVLLPVLFFFIVWNVIPTLWMIGLSFYRYSLMLGNEQFLGTRNYMSIMTDNQVWEALSRTFIWVGAGVAVQTLLGLLLGFLFWGSKDMPGRRLALTLLFTPMVLTPVAVGVFFRLLYEPTFGIVNYLTTTVLGLQVNPLNDRAIAFGAVLLVDTWMWTPFMILITLAALGSVPKAELEAAEIDRIPWIKRLRYIIWPNAKFILMLGILLRTIDSFKTLDLVYLMTTGGPGNTTDLIALLLRRKAFEAFDLGWSSAMAILLLLTAIAFTSIYLYILNLNRRRQEAIV